MATTDIATFGAGLSWWFPQRAVEFIERERLPGEIYNSYGAGGYLAWALGPQRRDYIDGRDTLFGMKRIQLENRLRETSPDSAIWRQEAEQYHINTIILSIARYNGLALVNLKDFCDSREWRPVYLDEVSAVFVRRTPETEDLILRSRLDCATAHLPPVHRRRMAPRPSINGRTLAAILLVLDRDDEALAATDKALAIFPGSAFMHLVRAQVLYAMGRFPLAEREHLEAIALHSNEFTWSALADFYQKQDRDNDAIGALNKAVQLSARPDLKLVQLGYCFLHLGRPKDALVAFDHAVQRATPEVTEVGEEVRLATM